MKNPKNNIKEGVVEFTIFEESDHYVGVCLTFDIVLEGNDYYKLKDDLLNSASLHLQTVKELGLSEDLLNRPAPQEYWDKKGTMLDQKDKPVVSAYYERTSYNPHQSIFNNS